MTLSLDGFIAVINTPPKFWLRFAPIPPSVLQDENRTIDGGPLLDLAGIQAALESGELDPDDMWVATNKADEDLYKLQWDERNVGTLLGKLQHEDYRKSEWCNSSCNSKHPCDVYVINYDDDDESRDWRAPAYYVKFSMNEHRLTLILISCHLDEYNN